MDKVFKVALFGMAANEQKTLGSIFKLAASRSRKYALVGQADSASADIFLIDVDDPKAIAAWKSFAAENKGGPIVKVTKRAVKARPNETILRRPLTLKRVLEILDKVTIDALKYVPELVVGAEDQELDAAANEALKDAASSAKQASKSNIKAMVIDDSAAVRKSMEIQLGLFGMNIDYAETGEEALEHAKTSMDYDIIFLDIMMPGIDGYKVCKTLRANKHFKSTPIIMLTGKGSRFDKLKGTMAGASLYLTKPVEQEQLQAVIKKFLPDIEQTS
ncbi:response regulator [Candidatus Venteria ishoeyi]|uniref:Alkaline phosphatase synthesis transcriptional regulatory protein PhoP n=1 Tax=Candidatus Venteria ishoeyi TaxID=1899563 RepID=A0A1H6F8T3_9GAMM|nr:response regulator [Candidatus Venteria ishoeyi]MDM8547195.1 response regulator [Candidatus Venteria ishoeyi]SEH06538.1 Alkaline phosphatase synthesis transcriptional regulatory protein PhoP [Candidatus Venteria ishoeyi]